MGHYCYRQTKCIVEMNEPVEIVDKQKWSFEDRHLNDEYVSGMMEFLSIDVDLSPGSSNREETLCSKNVMRKQRNWERRLEAKKSKRKEEKQRRKQNQQDKADVSQFSKRVIKAITRERLEEARAAGPRLCVDLSMTDCMSHKEISRLASQIRRLYGSNRKAMQPFHLFLTDMKEDSLLYKECIRMNEGFLNYLIDVTEESWIELFPCEDIIYLTPDASEALEEVNGDKVYILGGLVDESIQKKRTYTRAKELGVQMMRLPIDEYMMKRPNPKNFHSKILAINQVFEILLTYRDTGSWSKALSAGVPTGKGYIVSSETELDFP
ncbi:tRNA methyltransferase 10 homolog B [Ictalurus punctatus]|uniref:tRNA methyltransferase 10 homolog B n=1 Tax=Ictalurus punctatus TaxID=7998 RepID=E3TEX3_ICTPU|nr:tRNA methyltransferase 10 homolog B [Ictalurus punctatus]ADO28859.1 RNA (guanine-9-)-methyltransferase domain-containing protein 3 [Ictalurus punctatus]